MTTRLSASLAVAFIGVALASPLAAQTLVLKASVPFEFNFAGKVMPAGDYLFNADSGSTVMRVRSLDGGAAALSIGTHPAGSGERTGDVRITFNRYGSTYFLSSVVNGYTGAGFQAPISRAERELSRTASAQKFEVLATLARL